MWRAEADERRGTQGRRFLKIRLNVCVLAFNTDTATFCTTIDLCKTLNKEVFRMKLLFIFGLALAQNVTETTTAVNEQTTGAVPIDTTTAPSAETTRPVPETTTAPSAETTRPVPETTKPTTTPSEVTTTAAPIDPIPTGEDGIVRVRKDNETCAMVQFEGSYTLDDVTGKLLINFSELFC